MNKRIPIGPSVAGDNTRPFCVTNCHAVHQVHTTAASGLAPNNSYFITILPNANNTHVTVLPDIHSSNYAYKFSKTSTIYSSTLVVQSPKNHRIACKHEESLVFYLQYIFLLSKASLGPNMFGSLTFYDIKLFP